MANGIQDLTSIMTQGGREDIPQTMMGGMPPDMGGGLGAMMPQQSAPMPPPDMGGVSPDMGGVSPEMMMAEQMPMEQEPVSIEEDSIQLAGAVMERANEDPQTAVAILEGAAGLIMESTQQDPMMMAQDPMIMEQDPMMMAHGGPMYAMGGKYMKPKYAANGEYLSDENDTLRQMIMDRLQNSPITSMTDVTRGQGMILNEGDLMGMGRTMSDAEKDKALKGFNDKAMEAIRGITDDKDLRLDMGLDAEYYNMLEDERKRKEASERAKAYRSR